MKKGLKIWLIVWWFLLVAGWMRAGLTKAGIIPNYLNIKWLYHINCPLGCMEKHSLWKQSCDCGPRYYEDYYCRGDVCFHYDDEI